MQKKLAFILIMIFITTLSFVGCGKNKQGGALLPSAAKTVKQGGELVYGSLQEPNTLIPYLSNLLAATEMQSLIFSGLVTMDNRLEWQPDLAEVVPLPHNGGVSPDGLHVTYRLKRGVKWQDGQELTAADVKYTWQFIMDPKNPVVSRQGYDQIAGIDTPDPYTVMIRFRQPYAAYLTLFPAILPQHVVAREKDPAKSPFSRAPVGSGPFKVSSWNLADAIVLEANAYYYKGRPKLDRITYKILPDINIMLTQLKAGAIDIFSNVGFAQLDQAKAAADMQVLFTANMIWEHMDFNLDKPLFQDLRVRQAIAFGLDRQSLTAVTLKGAAVVSAADQPPVSWAYNPGLPPFVRDVALAKKLLAEAGWNPGGDGIMVKDGKRLTFNIASIAGNKARENVLTAIQQQLREIGVEVTFSLYAPDYFTSVLQQRNFDMALYGYVWGPDPDDTNLWNSRFIPSSANNYTGRNYSGWRNAEIDSLTVTAARTFDPEQRKQMYFRIQELIAGELPCIPLFFRANIDVVKNRVVNFQPSPIPAGNLWNAWEWGIREK